MTTEDLESTEHTEPVQEPLRFGWAALPELDGGEGRAELQDAVGRLEKRLEQAFSDLSVVLKKLLYEERELMRSLELRFRLRTRRLGALAKEASPDDFVEEARKELHVLTQRVRDIAVARSRRASGFDWKPSRLSDVVLQEVGKLPDAIHLPRDLEDERRLGHDARGWLNRLRRRITYGVANRGTGEMATRRLPVRQLMTWHLLDALEEGFGGVVTLIIHAEAAIADRLWVIYQVAAQEIEAMLERASDRGDPGEGEGEGQTSAEPNEPDAPERSPAERLAQREQREFGRAVGLWRRIKKQIQLADAELARYEHDIGRRVVGLLERGVGAAKRELADVGTIRLAAGDRVGTSRVEAHRRFVEQLDARFTEAREAAKRTFVAYALRVELYGYRDRGWWLLSEEIEELGEVVKNRFVKQVEMVRRGLDEVVAALAGAEAPKSGQELPSGGQLLDERIEKAFESLVRVVGKAAESSRQGRALFAEVKELTKALDEWAQSAEELTEYYRVPLHPLARSEWTLPATPRQLEVPFAKLVRQFVQFDVTPAIIEVVSEQASRFAKVEEVMQEAERVTRLGAEQFEGGDEELEDLDWSTPDRGRTRNVLLNACVGARDALLEMEAEAGRWASGLTEPSLGVLETKLDELEGQFTGEALQSALERLASREQAHRRRAEEGTESGSRSSPWDRRVATVWRALGLPRDQASAYEIGARLSPPRPKAEVPVYYRRLFAPQDTWVAEAVGFSPRSLEYLEEGGPAERLRTLALLAPELPSRRALVAAAGRTRPLKRARRIAFGGPVDARAVREAFADVPPEVPVVISGFAWMVSAAPGGFDAVRGLCELVLARRGQGAVVIDADQLVWTWASGAAPLEPVFSDRIEVPRFSPVALEQVLSTRQALSGMRVAYFGEEKDPRARERYFRDLHEGSDGLLPTALAHWLGSIERIVDEGSTQLVVLGSPPPSPHEVLRVLPEENLHVAYLTLRQGWMSGEVLSGLLGCRATTAEAMLAQMVGTGVLERHSSGVHVHRRHLAGAMKTVLAEREWL